MLGMDSVFSELITSYGSIMAVYYIYVFVLSFHYILTLYTDASNTVNVCAFTEGLFTLLCMMIMMVVVAL
jgi:hypothetical protein